jgi:hypothetical protein
VTIGALLRYGPDVRSGMRRGTFLPPSSNANTVPQ